MQQSEWRRTLIAAAWMSGLSLLLYFVPIVNGLVAGVMGGKRAGTLERALLATLAGAVAITIFTLGFRAYFIAPIWDLLEHVPVPLIALVDAAGLLVGALLGVAWANARPVSAEGRRR